MEKLLASYPLSDKVPKARESLKSVSAKVWLAEYSNEPCNKCDGCKGEWGSTQYHNEVADIINERWELDDCANSKYGRKAPVLTKLRVFGGFLNANHDEFIPSLKRFRAKEIYDYGWS